MLHLFFIKPDFLILIYTLPESPTHHSMRKARERRAVPRRSPRAVR